MSKYRTETYTDVGAQHVKENEANVLRLVQCACGELSKKQNLREHEHTFDDTEHHAGDVV